MRYIEQVMSAKAPLQRTRRPVFGLREMMASKEKEKAIRANYSEIGRAVNQVRDGLPPSSSHQIGGANTDVISPVSDDHGLHYNAFDDADDCAASIGSRETITPKSILVVPNMPFQKTRKNQQYGKKRD